MECYFCGWSGGKHHPACPNTNRITQNESDWRKGHADWRAGKPVQVPDNASYMLGFTAGNVALEEAENGFNPVIEGRQW
jgi:hypothetical protein